MSDTLLTLRDVHINFPARKNWLGKTTEHVHAINGIDLQIRRGETLGIVGESGCGKSTLAQLLMGMLQPSHGSTSVQAHNALCRWCFRTRSLRLIRAYRCGASSQNRSG